MDILSVPDKLMERMAKQYKSKYKELSKSDKSKTLLIGFSTLILAILLNVFAWNISRGFEEDFKVLTAIVGASLFIFFPSYSMMIFIDKKLKKSA